VAYIDDDAVVDGGWLEGFDEAWRENPDAGAITGLVLPFELATEAQVLFEQRGGFRRGFDKRRFHGRRMPEFGWYPHGSGNFGAGCNMVFRRDVLLRIGGFDEALDTGPPLPGGGDLDIFYRVARSGEPIVYEPRLLVFHQHRRDYAGLRRQYWSWGTGFMAFVTKHFALERGERRRWVMLIRWWIGYQLRRLSRSLVGRGDQPSDLVAAELLGGLIGLCGVYPRSQRRSARIRAQRS
jgi:GT2 family glycosyltransferase